ncbi:MAG: hypothetical protein JO166_16785 [Deltaproteobacteria bacterium]|nr:hypothetical protein [Deltaproteobacteria bacterium]
MKLDRSFRLLAIATVSAFSACAASHDSPLNPAAALTQSDSHIYITSDGLKSDCYQDLGEIALNETFAQSVVDNRDSRNQRLRELAREKFAAKVDAIINVREQENEAATAVEITGEAVHLENHETLVCAARAMPPVIDSASNAAAGGIVGTVIGGLAASGGSVNGAEAGGAVGATAAAGREVAEHRQQELAAQALISNRLQQQQSEIAQLYQRLAKLIGQQCNSEELSEQDCQQRLLTIQQEVSVTNSDKQDSTTSSPGGPAGTGLTTEYEILNRMQAQQELIHQLQQRIAQTKQAEDDQ